eukprot:GHVS01078269.1.p1 GENE.GHVS01078269.1~~GHVS01078269.1.p1  ORF type:complete len:423 (-),score=42.58 GHVS01078269.1:184-1452(-)
MPSPHALSSSLPIVSRPFLSSVRQNIDNALQLSKAKLSLWVACSTLPAPCHLLPSAVAAAATPSSLLPSTTLTPFCVLAISTTSSLPLTSLFLGTFMCSSAANTFNQISEQSLDARMNRTKLRPLPCNRLSPNSARLFAVACTACGVGVLTIGTNVLTGSLGFLNILIYAKLYTPLKLITPYNTHIGSIVGALPVLMGATAITGSLWAISPTCWALFAVQVLWQFPHFYALAWIYRDDYKNAGYKMFPLEDNSGQETARMIKPYLAALTALPIVCACCGVTSYMFIFDSLAVNGAMYFQFKKFELKPSKGSARKFFLHSLWHLFALLGLTAYHGHTACRGGDDDAVIDYEGSSPMLDNRSAANEDLFAELRRYLRTKCPHEHVKGMQDSCPLHHHTIELCRSWLGGSSHSRRCAKVNRKDCT